MGIRKKLLLTMLVPLALLIIQITAVNSFIRELQSAVDFISSAHSLIEADFQAVELVRDMRKEIKELPARYVSAASNDTSSDPLKTHWDQLTGLIEQIRQSSASRSVDPQIINALDSNYNNATQEFNQTMQVAQRENVDLDTLFERAIFVDKALEALIVDLDQIAEELRLQLQLAVDHEREIHNRPIQAGIIIGITAIVFLSLFAWVVSARALRPVSELMEGADRVANGDLNHEVPVRSTDEVGRLAHSFNDMAGQLHQSFDKLEVQNQELKRLDKLKDEFLANTSHELRTPLNGIIGLAESIIDGATGPLNSETEKNLSMVVSSGKRLESLVNDILDFSKLKNQAIELQRKPIDVYTMSELALTLSKALVGNKDLLLVNRVTPDAPLVLADENRIQQILLNLVGNAIKFTDAGEVSISASDEGDYLSVSISDTGIGIPEGQTERIFESFLQADGATAREYGGTGLGLTVTRQLVELHGGSIGVTSEEGSGSCFTFTLPVADPELRLEVGRQVSTIRIQPETLNTAPESPVKSDQLFISKTSADGKQHRVMIVDDEPVNLQVLANHLSLQNYSITHAQSGQEALDLLDREARFDVVLLDVMMPRMSGYEVCQKIRETYSPHELPVLMLTAKNQVPDLLNGFDAGANDYIAKPFSKEELLARLSTHIQLTKTTQSFGRFVPLEYLNYLDKDSIIDVDLGDHISKEMTVMFSDLRGFTAISEQMTPQENFDFVNIYLEKISPVVREHDGFIVKYLGDGMMAVFPGKSDDAVRAGIEKIRRINEYNASLQDADAKPIHIGIGINTGPMMVGIIGEKNRMQGDALSDNVNLTSRVEGLTKFYGVSFIVTAETRDRLVDPEQYRMRFLDKVQVLGKEQVLELFEVYDGDTEVQRQLKDETHADYSKALELYFARDFGASQALLFSVLKLNPKDKVAWHHLVQATNAIEKGVAENWNGVTRMDQK